MSLPGNTRRLAQLGCMLVALVVIFAPSPIQAYYNTYLPITAIAPPTSIANVTQFGVGTASTPDGGLIAVCGFNLTGGVSAVPFCALYVLSDTSEYELLDVVFGDLITTFLEYLLIEAQEFNYMPVQLSGDGMVLVFGWPYNDQNATTNIGKAYVFYENFTGDGLYYRSQVLVEPAGGAGVHFFCEDIDLSSDYREMAIEFYRQYDGKSLHFHLRTGQWNSMAPNLRLGMESLYSPPKSHGSVCTISECLAQGSSAA